MKILKLFLFVLAVSTSVVSCSKDKIENVSGNKYETTSAKINIKIGDIEHSVDYNSIEELKENELYLKVEFKSDNTFWAYEMTGSEEDTYDWIKAGTWSQKDSSVTINFDGETLTGKVDGSKIIVTMNFEDIAAKKLGLGKELPSGTIEWHFSKI